MVVWGLGPFKINVWALRFRLLRYLCIGRKFWTHFSIEIEIKEREKFKLDKFLLLFAIFHWRRERWQQIHWCDLGLRGWSVGRSPPGDPGWLKSTYKHPHPIVWAGWFLFRWPENKVSRTNGIYLVSEEWKIIHKAPAWAAVQGSTDLKKSSWAF